MTLQDIIILSSINPITVHNEPSAKTKEYLAKIIQDPNFNKLKEMFLAQYNLPKAGIDIRQFEGNNLLDLPILDNEFLYEALKIPANELATKMGFSGDFTIQILLLMLFNTVIDLEYFGGSITNPPKFILGKKNIAAATHDYQYELGAIFIPYNTNKTGLIKWIKENWHTIEKQLDEKLPANPHILRTHKNTEYALEIIELKDKKKMTFPEIATYMYEKYPEDKRMSSEEWIKKNYYTHKLAEKPLVKK